MKNIFIFISSLHLFVFSSSIFAHSGHDHQHWLSGTIHLAILSILAILAIITARKLSKTPLLRKIKKGKEL